MISLLFCIEAILLALITLFTLAFVISSLREGEGRAAFTGAMVALALVGAEVSLFFLESSGYFHRFPGAVVVMGGLFVTAGGLILVIRRTAPNPRALEGTNGYVVGAVQRFDEREEVFARNRSLPTDSDQYRQFYSEHPQWEEQDAKRRERGGPLGVPGTIDRPNEGPNIAAMLAAFSIPQHLGASQISQPNAHPYLEEKRVTLSPEEATARVKGFARHLGADLVGIAALNPYWVYAKRGEIFYGNWDQWGQEIDVNHPYAIVFAMEMTRDMVWAAPHTPSVLESAVVYAKGAYIATQVASFIANLGYSATANHIRHYDLLLVPMAVDAGLGEVGRLGYLITKAFGPRVRLGAVTTDLPLIADRPVDVGVEDFCRVCKKCARCCPSQSIPFEDLQEVNGTLRWKLNAETCFDYWGKVGSDCNLCMRVCPWSHPRTLPHLAIIELVVRNRTARRVFSVMDDVFYGNKPRAFAPPPWAGYK